MILEIFKKKEKEPEYKVRLNYDKTKPLTKRNVVAFLRDLGITVKTNTKARGNNGIFFKNRIDISRDLKDDKAIEVLVHEFAHYIHDKIETGINKTGGSLECIFKVSNASKIKSELILVTNKLEKNTKLEAFINAKKNISDSIKSMQKSIQKDYPNFQRSKKFVEFDKYVKNSDAKYLIKYDAIRIKKGWILKKERVYTVNNIENDFPDMPKSFQTYIKLCSLKRKQMRISRRITKMNKYYERPAELFARFVQGYFFNPDEISKIAPLTVKQFNLLLKNNYYKELKNFWEIFSNQEYHLL